jgi:hypothetical protein
MAVEVSAGEGGLMIGAVTKMFSLSSPGSNQGWFYDVAPDGQRFLMVVPQQLKLDGPPRDAHGRLELGAAPSAVDSTRFYAAVANQLRNSSRAPQTSLRRTFRATAS